MGQKCPRKRQYVLFCVACCLKLTILFWGCAFPPDSAFPPEKAYPIDRLATEEHLAKANYYMGQRNFDAALKESRDTLKYYPQLLGDRALFQIGLIYSHPENPDHDMTKAREAFGALINRYPVSSLRPQAELWILTLRNLQDSERILESKKRELLQIKKKLRSHQDTTKKLQDQNQKVVDAKDEYYQRAIEAKNRQIKELEDNINKLKEVDIKIEEKKRKTTP